MARSAWPPAAPPRGAGRHPRGGTVAGAGALLLVGGAALLREAPVEPSLRTRAEGLGELGMGAAAAVGGSMAGPLLATGGVALLGLVAAAPCLPLVLVLAAQARRAGRTRVIG